MFDGGRVRLTLALTDVAEALPEVGGGIDAWFLDGFSPARNPDMWTEHVLRNMAKASRPGATFATYTSAGWVRRGLAEAGFEVYKSPGFGHKREMLHGSLPGLPITSSSAPAKASICDYRWRWNFRLRRGIGFCARDVPVTLLESAANTVAAAASGNPAGILHAR